MAAVVSRYIIVCLPSALTNVNDTLRNIDPTSQGDNITVPMRLVGGVNTPAAYAGSWAMDPAVDANLKTAVRDAAWSPKPTAAEMTLFGPSNLGSVPSLSSGQRLWLFNGLDVSFVTALDTLGLAEYASVYR